MPAEEIESIVGATVLIVEDSEDLRYVFAACLEKAGADVRVSANAQDALDLLDRGVPWVPDVVFCDLHMPAMNGLAFIDKLRDRPPLRRVPIIAVSGSTTDEDLLAVQEKFDGYLLKPVTAAMLTGQVSLAIKAARERPASGDL